MASISSLGVGSGLNLSSIVSGLVEAERAPVANSLNRKEQSAISELSGFAALKSTLSLFKSSLTDLVNEDTYSNKIASSSSSTTFTAVASETADLGGYSVEVTALAKSQSLASSAATAFSSSNDTIGSGTLTIKFGATTTGPYAFTEDTSRATQTITVSEANGNNSLVGLKDYINDNDLGFRASIVNDGNGYRLILTSDNTGANNSMEITVTGDGDGNDTDNTGLSQLAFNAGAQSGMLQTVGAQDAALTINGLAITRETNTVTGAIEGVTLNLLKADIGNTVSLNVTENNALIKNAINGFIDGYNGFVETVGSLTSFNAETGEAGILIGDFTVRSISQRISNIISNLVPQLSGDIRALVDIGVTTTGNGTLALDTSVLDSALANNAEAVKALFTRQGIVTDSDIDFSIATDDTIAGEYGINVTALATQGIYNGTTVNNLTIDANNDQLSIMVDGISSLSISLTQNTYADGDTLAAHIQAQINNDSNLKDAAVSVLVTYDSVNNELDINSVRYGSSSTIEFLSVDTNTSTDIGFAIGSGIDGVDVSGTINGINALGSGQILTSNSGDSSGLALLISAGATGARGTVTYSRGIADALDDLLEQFLESDSFIDSREQGLNDQIEDINDQRLQLDLRIQSLEARLIQQFTALDILVAQFNSTSIFLTQQLANLPRPNSIGNNQ